MLAQIRPLQDRLDGPRRSPELPDLDDADEGPTLDRDLELSTEAEHEQLMLAMDGQEEIQPGRSTTTLRAYSSKSGLPCRGAVS
jgi:hypothetical protein